MTNRVSFRRPDGTLGSGFLATPSLAGREWKGNVVVIQEWWGLNSQIEETCKRLAQEGFRALAPDLYHGFVAQTAEEASSKMNALNREEAVSQDIQGAVTHLGESVPTDARSSIAVMGFCLGGALTLLSAAKVKGLSAAVCYYGIPPEQAADLTQIRVPVLGHFAAKDDWCTPESVDALEGKLRKAGIPHELYRYDASHAFANERRPEVYHPEAAKLAWKRSIAFLEKRLQ
jgi:carboxymethylenebutenolidase